MPKELIIGEHRCTIPDMPQSGIKIKSSLGGEWEIPYNEVVLNSGAHYEDAFWQRDYLPDYFYQYIPDETLLFCDETVQEDGFYTQLSDDDTRKLIYYLDREIHRRKYGVWFKNGLEYVYLTGHHYFFLQWMKLYGINPKLVKKYTPWRSPDYQFGEYMEFQRDVFYLIEHVQEDDDILGLYIAKPKKTGITQLFAAYYLNKATLTRDAQMGIMSKGDSAVETNMLFVIKGYEGLPPLFQPNTKYLGMGHLFFGEPPLRNAKTAKGKERRKRLLDAKPLDTNVSAVKTKEAAFDSPVMQDIWFDEFPKYWSENHKQPEIIFNRNLDSVKIQEIYNGRCWITTYPPEEDDIGFMQARAIYYDSKLSTIKEGEKRTKTGLIVFYISAIYSYRSCFDKYGKCDQNKAHKINQDERNKVKGDKKAYQAKIRQYSETEEECWGSAGRGSTFDLIRVNDLIRRLEKDMKVKRQFEDGRLEWTNKLWEAGGYNLRPRKTFGTVEWIPLTKQQIEARQEGRMRFYQHLNPNDIMLPLKQGRDKLGNLLPCPHSSYFGGTDPTEYAAEGEVLEGSKNGSYTMNFPDETIDNHFRNSGEKDFGSFIIISEYFHRPILPDEFYEDLVKEIIYTGKTCIVEGNKKWVATRLIEDGLGAYMLVRDNKDGVIKRWSADMYKVNEAGEKVPNWSLISNSRENNYKETTVRLISRYIDEPARDEDGKFINRNAKDLGPSIRSERLLYQLRDYSKDRDKLFDLVRAFGYALICYEFLTQPAIQKINSHLYSKQMIQRVASKLARVG